jgi:probable O-glycosylation ligase (exosortase A-associated)
VKDQMSVNTLISSRKGQAYLAISIAFLLFLFFRDSGYFIVLPFVLGAGLWILYEGFSKPSFFVLIFIVVSFFRIFELFPQEHPYPFALVAAFLGFFSLIINALIKKNELFWSQDMAYFIIFFLWVSVCMVVSGDLSKSFDAWSSGFLKVGIGFFLIAWSIDSKKDFFWFILICIASGVFISLLVFYNKFNAIGLIEGSRASISNRKAVIGDPNDLALLLLIPFSFSLVVFSSKNLPFVSRILGAIALIIISYGIILTQSRGGALGLLTISVFFLYRNIKSKSYIIFLGALILMLLYLMSGISERQPGLALDESANFRIEAWKSSIKMAIDHPLFGVGIDSFDDYFYLYRSSIVKVDIVAHSTWFSVLAENGFLGMILFIACVYHAFKTLKRSFSYLNRLDNIKDIQIQSTMANGIFYGLIGFCVAGSFLNQAYGFIFYTLFALAIALQHSLEKLQTKAIG